MIDEAKFNKAKQEIESLGAYYQEVDADKTRSDTILEVLTILDQITAADKLSVTANDEGTDVGSAGRMDCFSCGGSHTVVYSVANVDGRRRGYCEKCGMRFTE